MEAEIRWQQRFVNYKKALLKLEQSVNYLLDADNMKTEDKNSNIIENELLKEGLIQRFEYTFELAWNVMKDYALYQGNDQIGGSRDAIRSGFQLQIIEVCDDWMEMIQSRIKTTHTYNEQTAEEIYQKIITDYYSLFAKFRLKMEGKISGFQNSLF